MHDNLELIQLMAGGLTAALVFGYATHRIGLSPIVGYLMAGVLIGPYTPGYRGDVHLANQLAEIGVILLMFGVGLHFHLKDLMAVKGVAIPGAIGQCLAATLIAVTVFACFGLPWKSGTVMGMAMAVASTVVLMRVLMDAGTLNTLQGHVTVGWLVVEDLFTVILLVLIPLLADESQLNPRADHDGGNTLWKLLGLAFLKLVTLVVLVLFAGSRVIPKVMEHVARLRSRELFTLTVLVISIAIAAASYLFFGASMALGAFLAGMVVAQSPVSHQAAADALPLRDAFAVLFFISVGMLFDPRILLSSPWMIIAGLGIVLVAKPLTGLVIVATLGHSSKTALTVAIGLAQIGEFSFILSELARRHSLMPDTGHHVIIATAIISITLNPLLFRLLPSIESWLHSHPRLWHMVNGKAESRAAMSNAQVAQSVASNEQDGERLAIVVGYGPVGRSVHRLLKDAHLATVVIDLNLDTILSLRAEGQAAIYGDAAHDGILSQAGMSRASYLVLTLPHTADRVAVVAAARSLNPDVRILVRARYLRERQDLEHAGANSAVFEEVEAAVALARLVLADAGLHHQAAETKIKELRVQLIRENFANIRTQQVRSVMVPWKRVRWLPTSSSRDEVLVHVSNEAFSRWPVLDADDRTPKGYLLVKDLLTHPADTPWQSLLRPLKAVQPDNSVEAALLRMQDERDSMYLVAGETLPLGIVTFENMVEQVIGRIEDEYRHEAPVSLADALANGGSWLELSAHDRIEALRELAAAIPPDVLAPGVNTEFIVVRATEREVEVSTDLGNGVAIPHVKCPGIRAPIVVIGHSTQGIPFSLDATQPVRLMFLLLTPADQPDAQLELLQQVAELCQRQSDRDALQHAASLSEFLAAMKAIARQSGL